QRLAPQGGGDRAARLVDIPSLQRPEWRGADPRPGAGDAARRRDARGASRAGPLASLRRRRIAHRGGRMTTVGIDIGTSSVKVALVAADDRLIASASRPLSVSRPKPGFSEQEPEHWWQGVVACMDELRAGHGAELAQAAGIGLSGQMHG